MLEWLFGKKEYKKEKPQLKQEDQLLLGKDQKWIYDYIKQYLTSPIWRNPLLDFIEENCVIFDDNQENKFQYTKIFQEFTGLTALLLQSMIEEVGISEKTLEKCIITGIRSQKDAKIFKQILLCDNFLAFKKIMVSKNKELEVEALQKIHLQAKVQNKVTQQKEIQIDLKELQRIQIEKAIAMSMAVQEKALSQEEKELEEAIRLSQLQYQKEEQKKVQVKKEEPKEQKKKLNLLGPLPPLISAKPSRPIEQYKQEESKLKEEISVLRKKQEERKIKEKVQQQNSQERKKRLLEQRQLIRKQKQEERKEQLSNFVQHKPTTEVKLSEEELERRRNLMKRLKQQLKD